MLLNVLDFSTKKKYLYIINRNFADGLNSSDRIDSFSSEYFPSSPYKYSEVLQELKYRFNVLNNYASIHDNLSLCLKGVLDYTYAADYITLIELDYDGLEIIAEHIINIYEIQKFLEDRGLEYLPDNF